MSQEKFFVFGDESGCWQQNEENPDQLYIRSWIKITNTDFFDLKSLLASISSRYKSKEIKWSLIKNNLTKDDNIKNIFKIPYLFFISITDPFCAVKRLHSFRTYKLIEGLDDSEFSNYKSESVYKETFLNITKQKILAMLDHFHFMHTYEKQHIDNAKWVFQDNDYESHQWIIDNPSSCTKVLQSMIYADKGISYNDSKQNPGIQLADIIAGFFQDLLKDPEREEFKSARIIYLEFLKNKLLFKKNMPNPNIVFHSDSCIKKIDDRIRNNIWK